MAAPTLRHPVLAVRRARLLPSWMRRADARATRWINEQPGSPALDRALAGLSTAANRGVLWFSIAAVLTATGHRRAALRGVLSLAAASAVANLIGKQLFGGDRPLLKDVPLPRRLARTPTSASFPSGHSASAAAFVTGVALEAPAIGAALAPVAAGVAYSRVHTGAHWPSDVVGGVAIGTAIALLGGAVRARPRPRVEPPVRGDAVRAGLPASADGDRVFILVNPASGGRDDAASIATLLPGATVRRLEDGEDPVAVLTAATRWPRRPRVIGVCGGDGTVACAAGIARRRGLPLLVVPGGTLNHFAHAAGVASTADAVRALRAGTGRRVDLAELTVDDRPPMTVLNTASVGIYPDFVRERERLQDVVGKPIGSLGAALRVLPDAEPIEVTIDGRTFEAWSVFAGVDRYTPADAAPLRRAGTADGVLDVRILRAGSPSKTRGTLALTLGTTANAVFTRTGLQASGRIVESFTATELAFSARTRSGARVGYAHDGETEAEATSWSIRVLPRAIAVYAPLHAG